MNELAHAANIDPLALRLKYLGEPRPGEYSKPSLMPKESQPGAERHNSARARYGTAHL